MITPAIRDETAGDRLAIRGVIEAAFGRTDEADLVDSVRADGDGALSLVAVDEGRVVGHILFSQMTAPFRALGMAPVSVIPERQRTGIGGRLIRTGIDRAVRGGWEAVFVVGEPDYYCRFGFDAALASGFTSPYAGPYLMALTLGSALPVVTGKIEYARAFRTID